MEQVKYILYSILILVGAALTYAVMEPIMFSHRNTHLEDNASSSKKAPVNTTASIKNIAGKNLFSANCATCHALNRVLTGPALANVEERGPWTDRANLLKWVNNPSVFISTTPYTQQLSSQFNGQVMPSFPQLSDADKNQIFDYIKEASASLK